MRHTPHRLRRLLLATLLLALPMSQACGDTEDDAPAQEEGNNDVNNAPNNDVNNDVNNDANNDANNDPNNDVNNDVNNDAPPTTLGGARPAKVVLPAGYDPAQSWPLAILLHGFGANGSIQDAYLSFSRRAAEAGFIVVLPDGTPDSQGQRFWNATQACCDFEGVGPDDVAYITGLIEEATAALSVDATRIGLVGHSNGGFMSYRMACERADLVTGVVVLAGAMPSAEEPCEPSAPVSVMHVHGTADETIFFEGSDLQGRTYPSAAASAEAWVFHDGCGPDPEALPDADLVSDIDGDETNPQLWSGCQRGTEVTLWTMQGGEHIPVFTPDFVLNALDFLANHPRLDN